MRYVFTENDKATLLQGQLQCKVRCFIKNKNKHILGVYNDVIISNINIQSSSGIRRSADCTFYNVNNANDFLNLYMLMEFYIEVGIFNFRKRDYIWYPIGTFFINSASSSYDSTNNTFSCTLGDRYSKVDGTINGQVGGAPTITIPQKDANDNLISVQTALQNFIDLQKITDRYVIDDIGEFYGQQDMNPTGYIEYRKNHPKWNKLPYDLDFNGGDTEATIIEKIRDLYPNVEAYFDVYDNFCCGMIPSCNNDPVLLDNDYIQKILLAEGSESVTYDISSIKNVTEVFGKSYSIDRQADSSSFRYSGSTTHWVVKIDKYNEHSAGYMSIPIDSLPSSSSEKYMLMDFENINPPIPLYHEFTTEFVSSSELESGVNVIKITKDNNGNWIAYYLGAHQPHALCALTNNINDKTYTKKYFEDKYNCKHVTLRVEDSPYAIQKMGEILDVKSGEEYESIISNTVAEQNALYQNQISSSRNDTISLSTILIPWLDVNIKVSYKRSNSDVVEQYIVKSISHDFESMSSNITLQKFYPLYFE